MYTTGLRKHTHIHAAPLAHAAAHSYAQHRASHRCSRSGAAMPIHEDAPQGRTPTQWPLATGHGGARLCVRVQEAVTQAAMDLARASHGTARQRCSPTAGRGPSRKLYTQANEPGRPQLRSAPTTSAPPSCSTVTALLLQQQRAGWGDDNTPTLQRTTNDTVSMWGTSHQHGPHRAGLASACNGVGVHRHKYYME